MNLSIPSPEDRRNSLLYHIRPRRVPADALRFTVTFGLGGIAVLLVLLQLATGLLLSLAYDALPVLAYRSVRHIDQEIFLGSLVRSLHHWSGHALMVVVLCHLLRILFQGACFPPRRGNWYIGLGLGLLVLVANFSGYLLPWDQLAFWAVTVATSMLAYIPKVGPVLEATLRGGESIAAPTLRLFHTVHTLIVPVGLFTLLAMHCWRVRRAGGVLTGRRPLSGDGPDRTAVPFVPDLLVRELSMASVVFCLLLLWSMAFQAPLGPMANPDLTPDTVRAPWYFLGLQELLLHIPPVIAVSLLPLAVLLFLLAVPFLQTRDGGPSPLLKISVALALLSLLTLTAIGIWFRGPAMQLQVPW